MKKQYVPFWLFMAMLGMAILIMFLGIVGVWCNSCPQKCYDEGYRGAVINIFYANLPVYEMKYKSLEFAIENMQWDYLHKVGADTLADWRSHLNKGSYPPPPGIVVPDNDYYSIDSSGDTVQRGNNELRILGSRKHPFHFNKDTIEIIKGE